MILDNLFGTREYESSPDGDERRLIDKGAAFIIGLFLIFILLLTATEALCFWIPNWWRNEYAKYDTVSNVRGEMSLDDAVSITEDMLDYCIGRIDTLDNSVATIDGITQPFYTEREKMHLSDCRNLFMKGMRARVICILMGLGLFLYLYVRHGGKAALEICAAAYLKALAAVLIFAIVVAIASVIDFTKVFTLFHKIFFDNDLWILYPDKDNLINIMQEDVFSDAAMWIAGMWASCCLLLAACSVYILKTARERLS